MNIGATSNPPYQREDKALREEGVYLCTLLKLTEGVVRFFKAPEAEHLLLTPLGRLGVSGACRSPLVKVNVHHASMTRSTSVSMASLARLEQKFQSRVRGGILGRISWIKQRAVRSAENE
jgi:hypothetical protein